MFPILKLKTNISLFPSSSVAKASNELSNLINKLWALDKNRVVIGKDIRFSYQNQVAWFSTTDVSARPLFESVNTNVFQKPTFKGLSFASFA